MEMRRVLVSDGQGGGLGAQLIRQLLPVIPQGWELLAVGTNALATAAMLKAGAHRGATGENALLYHAGRAHLILGPIGLILANGILGEVSPAMAAAVSGAECPKLLIPSSACGVYVAGTEDLGLEDALALTVDRARSILTKG